MRPGAHEPSRRPGARSPGRSREVFPFGSLFARTPAFAHHLRPGDDFPRFEAARNVRTRPPDHRRHGPPGSHRPSGIGQRNPWIAATITPSAGRAPASARLANPRHCASFPSSVANADVSGIGGSAGVGWQVGDEARDFGQLGRRHHGVAKADIDLHGEPRGRESAGQGHPDPAVAGVLADRLGRHRAPVEHDPVLGDLERRNVAERRSEALGRWVAVAEQVDVAVVGEASPHGRSRDRYTRGMRRRPSLVAAGRMFQKLILHRGRCRS